MPLSPTLLLANSTLTPPHTHTHTLTHAYTHSHKHTLTHTLTHSHTHANTRYYAKNVRIDRLPFVTYIAVSIH